MSERTEEPTPRRLRRAQREGDAGVSSYAAQAVSFVVATALVPGLVAATAGGATVALRSAIARSGEGTRAFDPQALGERVLTLTVPFLIAVAASSAIVQAVQAGGVLATSRLAPRLDRLDPLSGLRNLFSTSRLFAVARSLAAVAVVLSLVIVGGRDHLVDFARSAGRESAVAVVVGAVAGSLAWRAALFGLALGVVDVVVTRRAWTRRLRMTKDEVKREHRESEGDPQLKAVRERAHHDLFAQAAVASVRHASVVVVNPTHIACALRYDAELDPAPVVVASGEGDLAARIVRSAGDHGIPVVRDVPLAHALAALSLGDAIPEALYEATAAVLGAIARPD